MALLSHTIYPPSANLHAGHAPPFETQDRLQCVRYAACELLDTAAMRAGATRGYSPAFLRYMDTQMQGLQPGDYGVQPELVARALALYGACFKSDYNGPYYTAPDAAALLKAKQAGSIRMRPVVYRNDDPVETAKWYVCNGMAVLITMLVGDNYRQAVQGVPWRLQRPPVSSSVYEHAMPIVEYDDVAQMFRCKNSEGPDFGDNGSAGLQFKNLRQGSDRIVYQMWVIDQDIYPLKKVEGFMPGLATLTPAELGPEVALRRAALKAAEDAATEAKRIEWTERVLRHQPANASGWQWAVDAFVQEGLTDRNADIVFRQAPGWFLLQAQTFGLDTSKLAKDPF